jgi:hypothetical protein
VKVFSLHISAEQLSPEKFKSVPQVWVRLAVAEPLSPVTKLIREVFMVVPAPDLR